MIRLDSTNEQNAKRQAIETAYLARYITETRGLPIDIRGPVVAPVAKIRERFRFQILLRSQRPNPLLLLGGLLRQQLQRKKNDVTQVLDMDPVNML